MFQVEGRRVAYLSQEFVDILFGHLREIDGETVGFAVYVGVRKMLSEARAHVGRNSMRGCARSDDAAGSVGNEKAGPRPCVISVFFLTTV